MQISKHDILIKKMLTKVKNKLINNPKSHQQDIWIDIKNKWIDNVCDLKESNSKYNCKTPCCFAGHIVYESNFHFKDLMKGIDNDLSIENAAQEIVGKFSDDFWRYITRGDFGINAGKSKQTKLYIKLLDLIIRGRSEDYIKAHLLEFFPNELFSRDKEDLKRQTDTNGDEW